MAKRWRFDKVLSKSKAIKRSLPVKLANIVLRHFQGSFRQQGWTDQTFNPWAARKTPEKGSRRSILVKSGDLRGSIRVRSTSFSAIRVGSYGLKYSQTHNRGLGNMPERKFIGPSQQMTAKIRKIISVELKNTFR